MTEYLKGRGRIPTIVAVLAVLVHLGSLTQCEAQPPPQDPCKGIDCQKGQCNASSDIFGYECQCDQGWTKIVPFLPFLGCGIPDCQLNFTCGNSSGPVAAPVPAPVSGAIPTDHLCGNGQCVTTPSADFLRLPSFKCKCDPGNYNIFNWTSGICLPGCNLEGSCPNLGIPLTPVMSTPPVSNPEPNPNAGPNPEPNLSPNPNAGKRQNDGARGLTRGTCIMAAIFLWMKVV